MNAAHRSLVDRVLMSFPSGSYCLPALLRILEIVESTHVPTACVECCVRPRMYINPQFVDEHAATAEKLLMLVMHELHHVILGHTRLYPRPTPLDNLVFDVVINAMLCQLFPSQEYTALFTDYYPDDKFPECFLRPASGWRPQRTPPVPRALRGPQHAALAQLHQALYSDAGVTYSELRSALSRSKDTAYFDTAVLLGDHRPEEDGASSAGSLEDRSPALLQELRRIVERWPQPPDPLDGRSSHDMLDAARVQLPPPSNRAALGRLLRKIGRHSRGRNAPRWTRDVMPVQSPVPRFDRRSCAISALGGTPLLYQDQVTMPLRQPSGSRVHVYLDVSGSIANLKGALYAAVLDCIAFVHPTVHLFSTVVHDISTRQLRRGVCKTTSGTSIACVAAHIRNNHVKRAVLITDGFVGAPGVRNRKTLLDTRLGVALTPDGHTRDDLHGVTDAWVELQETRS